jgi:hypothetical protein
MSAMHTIERTIRLSSNRFTIQCSCGWTVTSEHGQTMGGMAWAEHATESEPGD